MLHCAICDDNPDSAEALRVLIKEYSEELCCDVFFDADSVLKAQQDGAKFDLYILDIIMPEFSGIDLAREIRKHDENGIIIFLSSSNEFYKEAFAVEALQYLSKPVDKDQLFRTLDRALIYKEGNKTEPLPIRTKAGLHSVCVDQIVYVESFRHVITFYLENKREIHTLDSSISLKELLEVLSFPPFYSPHRGFIVNLAYVNCLEKQHFLMTTGATIPIPQKQFSKVRQQYSDYLLLRCNKGEL